MSEAPRRSLGGTVVDRSLEAAGFQNARPGLAMVESARPRRRPYDTVLVQNAWNTIGWDEFLRLLKPYPVRAKIKLLTRRIASRINIRRASTVVCLTRYMAHELDRNLGCRSVLVPVGLPLDIAFDDPSPIGGTEHGGQRELLVLGTISWYKNPGAGLEVAAALRELGVELHATYLGPVDGSGAWQATQAEARRRGLTVTQEVIDREAMPGRLRRAYGVVLGSDLESLSIGMWEALALAPRVYASPIPVHREAAKALGREPNWLPSITTRADPGREPSPVVNTAAWRQLGEALGLSALPPRP